jgi:hypothetical protein
MYVRKAWTIAQVRAVSEPIGGRYRRTEITLAPGDSAPVPGLDGGAGGGLRYVTPGQYVYSIAPDSGVMCVQLPMGATALGGYLDIEVPAGELFIGIAEYGRV